MQANPVPVLSTTRYNPKTSKLSAQEEKCKIVRSKKITVLKRIIMCLRVRSCLI